MNRLAEARERLGWSKSRLAREAGVTAAAVRKWERDGTDRMQLRCAVRVAAALGVRVDDLLDGSEPPRR